MRAPRAAGSNSHAPERCHSASAPLRRKRPASISAQPSGAVPATRPGTITRSTSAQAAAKSLSSSIRTIPRRLPAPADPGGWKSNARAPLGPEKPARSKATACGARSPSFSSQFVAVNPAPVSADRARPSSPISPTSRPSLLNSKTGRSASAQSPSPANKGSTAQACARPRISTAQTPAAAINGTAQGPGAGMGVTAPSSPATQWATNKIQRAANSISKSAGIASPKGAKSAAIAPAAISTLIIGTVSRFAKSP